MHNELTQKEKALAMANECEEMASAHAIDSPLMPSNDILLAIANEHNEKVEMKYDEHISSLAIEGIIRNYLGDKPAGASTRELESVGIGKNRLMESLNALVKSRAVVKSSDDLWRLKFNCVPYTHAPLSIPTGVMSRSHEYG